MTRIKSKPALGPGAELTEGHVVEEMCFIVNEVCWPVLSNIVLETVFV